jgi:hypothetical protein
MFKLLIYFLRMFHEVIEQRDTSIINQSKREDVLPQLITTDILQVGVLLNRLFAKVD